MNDTAGKVLDAFDALPEPDRREVAREILRRTASATYRPLDDEELVALADDVLLSLDHDESPR